MLGIGFFALARYTSVLMTAYMSHKAKRIYEQQGEKCHGPAGEGVKVITTKSRSSAIGPLAIWPR